MVAMDRIHYSTAPFASRRKPIGYADGSTSLAESCGRVLDTPNASQALDMLCHGVVITDTEARVVYMNRRAEMIIGRTHKQVLGNSIVETLVGAEYQLRGEGSVRSGATHDGQFTVQLESDGVASRFVEVRVMPLLNESAIKSGDLYEIHAITESAQCAKQLIHEATHDGLTELTNKAAFLVYLKRDLEAEHERIGAPERTYDM